MLKTHDVLHEQTLDSYLDRHGITHVTERELITMKRLRRIVPVPPRELWPNIIPTGMVFEMIREQMGHPLVVGNGYRPLALNKLAGSKAKIPHPRFHAIDIDLPSEHNDYENRRKLYRVAVALWLELKNDPDYHMRIGLYRRGGGARVHIDTGIRKWWWQYRAWNKSYVREIAREMR